MALHFSELLDFDAHHAKVTSRSLNSINCVNLETIAKKCYNEIS
jgi:hypothetical protein